MKNRLAAKILISAAAILVMVFAWVTTLLRRRAAPGSRPLDQLGL